MWGCAEEDADPISPGQRLQAARQTARQLLQQAACASGACDHQPAAKRNRPGQQQAGSNSGAAKRLKAVMMESNNLSQAPAQAGERVSVPSRGDGNVIGCVAGQQEPACRSYMPHTYSAGQVTPQHSLQVLVARRSDHVY